jgi:DNA-binding beta-propeller fold protein YncE
MHAARDREAGGRTIRARPPVRPWTKSSETFSRRENLRFSWVLRTRHVIRDVRQALWPQPAIWSIALLLAGLAAPLGGAAEAPRTPGPQPDGSVVLPNQWSLRPVGRQVEVGDFPSTIAVHPSGSHAVVLHCGYGPHELAVLDVAGRRVVSRVGVEESFHGLTFDAAGRTVYASGAGSETILRFRFEEGVLVPLEPIRLRDEKERGIPAGIALTADGMTLVAANVWGQSVSRVRLDGEAPVVEHLPLTEAAVPAPARTPATTDDPSITKRADGFLERTVADLPYPYGCLIDEKRGRVYVSLWAQAAVAVVDLGEWKVVDRFEVEEHPNEMLLSADGSRLFVANANRNSVSVVDSASGRTLETLLATLTPDAAPGNTPNSLALSADGSRLFVANANINAVAVFDVSRPGASRSLGFIPTGWYPTSVRLAGSRLLVANGKGVISDSNRNGPRPGFHPDAPTPDYIGRLFQGTVSCVDLPGGEALARKLGEWTVQAVSCRPPSARDELEPAMIERSPVPLAKGRASPITHVLYVIKENRTFDQVLGDMPQGRGDPTLCLFPEEVTPNHHALAREFVLLDNFYVESEVSADGHEWTLGAYATDFVEKHWPLGYGHNRRGKFPYPSEGAYDAAARPAGGYLWDRAIAAGVSVRSYGEWVANAARPDQPGKAKVKALEGRFDPFFRSFDMRYSDLDRAARFISELERFDREGEMPRLQIVRLPNDHTSGASPGLPTPRSYMAENDLALGRLVEAVSRSRFWPTTAIFVVEDDAQNGPDHIDAHRTIAFVAGPHVRRGAVDSTLYSTSSMLRTIELILGLEPMSQFDAAAMPMLACFTPEPDATPFVCRPARVPLDELNAANAWGARASLAMDFSREDAADDLLLNEIVWRSVRGAASPMPAPRRAAFVLQEVEEEDDEAGGNVARD